MSLSLPLISLLACQRAGGRGNGLPAKPPVGKQDIAHHHCIAVFLEEIIRLIGKIDKVIEAHGGWPIE